MMVFAYNRFVKTRINKKVKLNKFQFSDDFYWYFVRKIETWLNFNESCNLLLAKRITDKGYVNIQCFVRFCRVENFRKIFRFVFRIEFGFDLRLKYNPIWVQDKAIENDIKHTAISKKMYLASTAIKLWLW